MTEISNNFVKSVLLNVLRKIKLSSISAVHCSSSCICKELLLHFTCYI